MKGDNLYHEFHDSTPAGDNVTIGTSSTQLVPRNMARIGLVIMAPTTNPLFLTWTSAAGTGAGIRLAAGGPPLVLSAALHGALVFGPIFGAIPAGAEVIGYVEASSNCPCVKG